MPYTRSTLGGGSEEDNTVGLMEVHIDQFEDSRTIPFVAWIEYHVCDEHLAGPPKWDPNFPLHTAESVYKVSKYL